MSANTILLLQSILIFLQMVNAAVGTTLHLPITASVLISAGVGAFQYYMNHIGNGIQPPSAPSPKP